MKSLQWIALIAVMMSTSTQAVSAQEQPSAPPRASRAILFIIDGLHWQAPQRLGLQNINALAEQGTSFDKACLIMPAHPRTGDWAAMHSGSIPNPVMLAGTLFIRPGQKLVQDMWYPELTTAHVTNSRSYRTLDQSNSFSMMEGGGDELAVNEALRLLRTYDEIRFMRIHLQDTGSGGWQVYRADPDTPWRHNIWADGSPYVRRARKADALLGQFVEQLKQMGKWDDTLLIVTSDHGQVAQGAHPAMVEESWYTPLIFVGPGVQASNFDYAEHVDIIPTLCRLMGVDQPNTDGASGEPITRVITGAQTGEPSNRTQRLNRQLRQYELTVAELMLLSEHDPSLATTIEMADRRFYSIGRFAEWHKAGTLQELMAVNEKVLEDLRQVLTEARQSIQSQRTASDEQTAPKEPMP